MDLEYLVKKNIKFLGICFFIVLIIYGKIFSIVLPTLINVFSPIKELDYDKAFSNERLITLKKRDKMNIFDNEYDVEYQAMNDYLYAYREEKRYKFYVKPEEIKSLDLHYSISYTLNVDGFKTNSIKPIYSYKYMLFNMGDAYLLAKVNPDFQLNSKGVYTGIFVPLSIGVKKDLQEKLGNNVVIKDIFTYEFDTIKSFSEFEESDLLILFIASIVLITIGVLLIRYLLNYRCHPTYKQLNKLGGEPKETEIWINAELKEIKGNYNNKVYRTKYWIIKRGLFKTKISRLR